MSCPAPERRARAAACLGVFAGLRGAFYRGYPQNDPPPDRNDEAAVKAITGVDQGGRAHLKKLAEGH